MKFTTTKDTVLNVEGEVIAKITNDTLDVRRPAKLERPNKVNITGSLAETFAEWYHALGCAGAEIADADMEERFGFIPKLPAKIPAPKNAPFGAITFSSGENSMIAVYCNGKIVRVGLIRERSTLWAYPAKLAETRNTVSSTKATDPSEVFRIVCGSFTGSFRSAFSAPKKDSKVTKPAPSKPAVLRKGKLRKAPKRA